MNKLIGVFFIIFGLSTKAFSFDSPTKTTGRSNPDIGANILLLGQGASTGSGYENGYSIQEIELQMSANIDPYWSGYTLLAIHPEEEDGEHGYHFEPEEVYFENLMLPGFAFRIGKQKMYFGKLNSVHTHAQPFVDSPLTVTSIFGEEGLNDTGVSASYLFGTSWYSELILQFFNSENEAVFGRGGHSAQVVYFKNMWDLPNNASFEWILSAGSGDNTADETANLLNTAVTYKWRPEASSKKGMSGTAEYTESDVSAKLDSNDVLFENLDKQSVTSIWLTYQFAQQWFAALRTESATIYAEDAYADTIDVKKQTLLVGYAPTEFSAVRLQYETIDNSAATEDEYRFALQFNFSMGAHPAHSY